MPHKGLNKGNPHSIVRGSYDAYMPYMPHLLICMAIRDKESWPDRWLAWLKLHVTECGPHVWVPGLDSFPPVAAIHQAVKLANLYKQLH